MDPSELCPNLLKWLSTFDDCQHVSIPEDISSGVIVANVLHQIEPVWFSQSWLEKINTDAGDNWRLKARNLKKVSQAIVDYLGDNLEFDVSHLSQPEPNKLAEQADHEEAARLVQLVLGVAINCPRKQEFIEAIRMLEPSVQTVLMTAIQQLMTSSASVVSAGQPDSCNSWLAEASRLTHELQLACDERDALTQRCFEQERQLQLLQSDKVAAQAELHQLQTRLGESVRSRQTTADPAGEAVLPPGGDRYKQLRVKLDAAHDEIYRLETSRDELKSKYEECNRELSETRTRADELQRTADESRGLKDELDILREKSIKVSQYESSLETYKRRLQEMSDLRGQIRVLELKNAEYVQINCELEEEVAKSGCYRPQLDIYKQRVAELNEQLTEKNTRLDWLESERRILAEKLATIQQERDRVIEDRNRMKETLEELCLSQFAQQSNHAVNSSVSSHASVGPPLQQSKLDILSNVPAEIRDQMLAIRHESGLMSRYECSDSPNEIISDTVDTGDAYRQLVAGFKKCHSLQLLELRSASKTSSGSRLFLLKRCSHAADCCPSTQCACCACSCQCCCRLSGATARYFPLLGIVPATPKASKQRYQNLLPDCACLYICGHRRRGPSAHKSALQCICGVHKSFKHSTFLRHIHWRFGDTICAIHCPISLTESLCSNAASSQMPHLYRGAITADEFSPVCRPCHGISRERHGSVSEPVLSSTRLLVCDGCGTSPGSARVAGGARRYTDAGSGWIRHERWPHSQRHQLASTLRSGVGTSCSLSSSDCDRGGNQTDEIDNIVAEDSDFSCGASRHLLRCWKSRSRSGRSRFKQSNVAAYAVGAAMALCAP